MPVNQSVENNFVGGLKTEFTGLNFPENACTAADNCIFTIIGDVLSREGIDLEANFSTTQLFRQGNAVSTYKWNNVGGDGETQVVVLQVGTTLYFYQSTNATIAAPLSTTLLTSQVNLLPFAAISGPSGGIVDQTLECQFSDGNGYLFVYHPSCDPFYCVFNAGTITGKIINVQIRDFVGVVDTVVGTSTRPTVLSSEHKYNLQNQGWTSGNTWFAVDNTTFYHSSTGTTNWTVQSGITGTSPGQAVQIVNSGVGGVATGTLISYSGTAMQINVTSVVNPAYGATGGWTIYPLNASLINTWNSAIGNFPSNADVWWTFKDTTDVFNPATTISNVTLGSGPAPKGFYVLNAFHQQRSIVSGVAGLTDVTTTVRPRTGTWFQGRVWFTGIDASQQATGDSNFYTWTENIYFSTIVQTVADFGTCYQNNDPTSENFFDLLPSDGGVITIQGAGSIYKLFPVQNGLLVFAANGVWFITGRQGIGFTANDYTVTKISGIQSISSTSFINVLGYPMFWNEEGIYAVAPSQTGSLNVENLCLGTILTFYQGIPLQSKKYARGDYDPINFQVQWCFRDTNETTVTDRYQFDRFLILNTANKAFYTYTISTNSQTVYVHDIRYVVGPGGSTSPDPILKYLTSWINTVGSYNVSFSEERDNTNWEDWVSFGSGIPYTATFTTGYKLRGAALRKWVPIYINLLSRTLVPTGYFIDGIWDYSQKQSTRQRVVNGIVDSAGMKFNRVKIRGHGYALQIQVSSIPGMPFEIMGWAILEDIKQSV